MVDITIFRIDLGGSSFTASRPFGSAEDRDEDDRPVDEDNDGRGRGIPLLVGLLFLIGIAFLVKRVLDGDAAGETP